jgi:hypothetical protein
MASQAALRAHGAKAQKVFDEALAAERVKQGRRQAEAIQARVKNGGGIAKMLFNGSTEVPAWWPLDPIFEQRAQQAALRARNAWLEKNPLPYVEV